MSTVHGRARAAVAVLASAGLLAGTFGVQPAAADTQMTAVQGVNIRQGPSTTSTIVGGLYAGQTVTAIVSSNGWTKVRFGGTVAYIATQYLTTGATTTPPPVTTTTGATRITTTDVNLRSGPGLSYRVLSVVRDGSRVTLTGKSSRGYAQVTVGASTGWISLQYLASTTTALPKIIGTRVATAALSIRTGSADNAPTVGEIKKGATVSITGTTQNGRAQIVYNGAVRWVTAKYLSNSVVTAPTAPGLPAVTGTRYATTALLIRSSATGTAATGTEVPKGTVLSITGVVSNGRAQIVYNNAVRWVTASYLSTTKPSTTTTPTTGSYAVERGLKPNAIKVHRATMAQFPQIVTFYGVRPDSIPDHPSGRALDLMLPGNYKSASARALGKSVADWARANARTLGIEYVIWDQHIWNIRRDAEGWRYMASRGSDSANHKNHVHITVFG